MTQWLRKMQVMQEVKCTHHPSVLSATDGESQQYQDIPQHTRNIKIEPSHEGDQRDGPHPTWEQPLMDGSYGFTFFTPNPI